MNEYMCEEELKEFKRLTEWNKSLKKRMEKHNKQRRSLMREKRSLKKSIDELEKKYER